MPLSIIKKPPVRPVSGLLQQVSIAFRLYLLSVKVTLLSSCLQNNAVTGHRNDRFIAFLP